MPHLQLVLLDHLAGNPQTFWSYIRDIHWISGISVALAASVHQQHNGEANCPGLLRRLPLVAALFRLSVAEIFARRGWNLGCRTARRDPMDEPNVKPSMDIHGMLAGNTWQYHTWMTLVCRMKNEGVLWCPTNDNVDYFRFSSNIGKHWRSCSQLTMEILSTRRESEYCNEKRVVVVKSTEAVHVIYGLSWWQRMILPCKVFEQFGSRQKDLCVNRSAVCTVKMSCSSVDEMRLVWVPYFDCSGEFWIETTHNERHNASVIW